jgi:hypothetical protein
VESPEVISSVGPDSVAFARDELSQMVKNGTNSSQTWVESFWSVCRMSFWGRSRPHGVENESRRLVDLAARWAVHFGPFLLIRKVERGSTFRIPGLREFEGGQEVIRR